MKITYYGHSCFVIESGGYRVCLDPYDETVPGYKPLCVEAESMLFSHGHFDHNYAPAVKLSGADPEACEGYLAEGQTAVGPFKVTEIHSWHDPEQGRLRGNNIIRIYEAEGLKVAHLGDIGCRPEPSQMELLKGIDCIMVPVGGTFTITAEEANALMDELAPRMVKPMHYRKGAKGFDKITTLDDFTALRCDVVYGGNCVELKEPVKRCTIASTQ